jgi:hypothetical protein
LTVFTPMADDPDTCQHCEMPEAGGVSEDNPAGWHDFSKGGQCTIQSQPTTRAPEPETVVIDGDGDDDYTTPQPRSAKGLGKGVAQGSSKVP